MFLSVENSFCTVIEEVRTYRVGYFVFFDIMQGLLWDQSYRMITYLTFYIVPDIRCIVAVEEYCIGLM